MRLKVTRQFEDAISCIALAGFIHSLAWGIGYPPGRVPKVLAIFNQLLPSDCLPTSMYGFRRHPIFSRDHTCRVYERLNATRFFRTHGRGTTIGRRKVHFAYGCDLAARFQ